MTGRGHYAGDTIVQGMLRAHFLRSPYARALVHVQDRATVCARPGVHAVITGNDMVSSGVGTMPLHWNFKNTDGSGMFVPDARPLAENEVRFVGQPYAVIVADTDDIAQDAAEELDVTFEELPTLTTMGSALKPGAPAIWPGCHNNTCLHWSAGDAVETESAFSRAAHVVSLELTNHRIAALPIEPRIAAAHYDAGRDHITLTSTCQLPHELQTTLASVLGLSETRIDVVSPDIGGGFGMKSYMYPEDAVICWAARRLGRDVAWINTRGESFQSDAAARDHVTLGEIALDAELNFLALRVSITANMGAYLSQHSPAVPTVYCCYSLPGPYLFKAAYADVRCVFTNTAPVDAYRGAGRSEAVYVTERLIDHAARKLGVDSLALRRQNLAQSHDMPCRTAMGSVLDSGDPVQLLANAARNAGHDTWDIRRKEARNRNRLRGIGMALYAANCGGCTSRDGQEAGALIGSWESARLQVHPSGSSTLYVGSHNHGQGHETAFAQIVSDLVGIDIDDVEVVFGDTRRVQRGLGTFASRSAVICGPATMQACRKVIAKATQHAAALLEAEPENIDLVDGQFRIRGTNHVISFSDVAHAAYTAPVTGPDGLEPGLDETSFYDPEAFTWPMGAHIAEVEIDPETGQTDLIRYVAVDDVGVEINPIIVEGQLHGGIVQGVGQALGEAMIYDDESGQLLSGSFMDYPMPRADTLCGFESNRLNSRCTTNPLGAKGVGEAGTFAAPAAVTNAVLDALAQHGIQSFDMPATPHRVWRALQESHTDRS